MMKILSNRKKRIRLIIIVVIVIVIFTGDFVGYSFYDEARAKKRIENIMSQMSIRVSADSQSDYSFARNSEMPLKEIDGDNYIGQLDMMTLGLNLPIMAEYDKSNMKNAPVKYDGSPYGDSLVICGNDYKSHFGQLQDMMIGDVVMFTDVDGNRFFYEVSAVDKISSTSIEDIDTADWDLSLFVCNFAGKVKVEVFCKRIQK